MSPRTSHRFRYFIRLLMRSEETKASELKLIDQLAEALARRR